MKVKLTKDTRAPYTSFRDREERPFSMNPTVLTGEPLVDGCWPTVEGDHDSFVLHQTLEAAVEAIEAVALGWSYAEDRAERARVCAIHDEILDRHYPEERARLRAATATLRRNLGNLSSDFATASPEEQSAMARAAYEGIPAEDRDLGPVLHRRSVADEAFQADFKRALAAHGYDKPGVVSPRAAARRAEVLELFKRWDAEDRRDDVES